MFKKILFLLFLFIECNVLFGQSFSLDQLVSNPILLGNDLRVYTDQSHQKLIQEVIEQSQEGFHALQEDEIKSGLDDQHTYWLSIPIHYTANEQKQFVLKFDKRLDSVQVFSIYQDQTFQLSGQTGLLIGKSEKQLSVSHLIQTVPFQVGAGKQLASLLIRVRNVSHYPVKPQVALYTRKTWENKYIRLQEETNLFQSFFHGMLWIMIIYNLIASIFTKDRNYLFYTLYIFGVSFFTLQSYGYLDDLLLTEMPVLSYYCRVIGLSLAAWGYIGFSLSFLEGGMISRSWKVILKIWIVLVGLSLTSALINFSTVYHIKFYNTKGVIFFALLMITFLVFYVNLLVKHHRNTLIRYFLAGSTFVVLGGFVSNFLRLTAPEIFEHVDIFLQFGIVLELTFFSLGLAHRMKVNEQKMRLVQAENNQILQNQNEVLEDRVKERTLELSQKNDEILTQNEELQQQAEEIKTQKEYIESQNHLLEEQHLRLTDSMRYASTIQGAILPPTPKIQALFEEHFALYIPKDIVSGDFYWVEQIGALRILVVGDCTGHGIPGAFMSMIGINALHETIIEKKILKPSEILENIHQIIKRTLNQNHEDDSNNDGMELALCIFQETTEGQIQVAYAGAKRPLYYMEAGQIVQYKGTRRAIGGYQGKIQKPFEDHRFELSKGTTIYLTTDGFADQNGTETGKIGSKRLRSLLAEAAPLPFPEQKSYLQDFLIHHQKDEEQRDDITIVGVKI